MLSVNKGSFTSSLFIVYAFITFLYSLGRQLLALLLIKTSCAVMNVEGNGHPCHISDLGGKAFSWSPLSPVLVLGFS